MAWKTKGNALELKLCSILKDTSLSLWLSSRSINQDPDRLGTIGKHNTAVGGQERP